MRIIGRILSCIFAFVLAVTVLGTHLAVLAHHVVGSEAFLKQPAQSIRPEQLQKMNEFVGKLSDEYGFDPSSISGEISADAFERYGNEVVSFLGTLLKEQQEEDAELIFPYFMTTNMLDTVRDDPGFQAKMEKGLQRTVSQNDIVTPVEQMAQRLIFPIRPQLIIAGYNTVSETVNIPDALRILDKWWVIPAAGVLLILLILSPLYTIVFTMELHKSSFHIAILRIICYVFCGGAYDETFFLPGRQPVLPQIPGRASAAGGLSDPCP